VGFRAYRLSTDPPGSRTTAWDSVACLGPPGAACLHPSPGRLDVKVLRGIFPFWADPKVVGVTTSYIPPRTIFHGGSRGALGFVVGCLWRPEIDLGYTLMEYARVLSQRFGRRHNSGLCFFFFFSQAVGSRLYRVSTDPPGCQTTAWDSRACLEPHAWRPSPGSQVCAVGSRAYRLSTHPAGSRTTAWESVACLGPPGVASLAPIPSKLGPGSRTSRPSHHPTGSRTTAWESVACLEALGSTPWSGRLCLEILAQHPTI
jgi:hypothetical protein